MGDAVDGIEGTGGAVTLPARLDSAAADDLRTALTGDGSVALDAGGVEMLGGLCLEVILRASSRRIAAGTDLTLTSVSDAFRTALTTFGLTPDGVTSAGIVR